MLEVLTQIRIDHRYTTVIEKIYKDAEASVRPHEDATVLSVE